MAVEGQRVFAVFHFIQWIVTVHGVNFNFAAAVFFDGAHKTQHFAFIARLRHASGEIIVQLRQARHKGFDVAGGIEVCGQNRFDNDVGKLKVAARFTGQNQQLARDVHTGKIVARIRFGIAHFTCYPRRFRQAHAFIKLAEDKGQRAGKDAGETA